VPKIDQFNAGNVGLRPTDTGVDAVAKTAQRVGMFYNQRASAEETLARETDRLGSLTKQLGGETGELGSQEGRELTNTGSRIGGAIADAGAAAVKVADHQQISQGAASFATLLQSATDSWNNAVKNADPNDPTIAPQFMASLNDQLSKFKENGFYTEEGQKWAEAHVDALRQHMVEKTSADMSTLAGQAIVVNQQKTINSLSNTVHSDPSSIDFALAALKSSTEGLLSSSPNISGVQAGAARSEILQKGAESIVKSAAIGYINKTGQMPPWATDPKYAPYVNGTELQMFEKAAQTQAKANALADKQTQVAQRQLDDLNVHKDATKVITDNLTFDPQTGQPIVDPKFFKQALDIARNNPNAPSAAETVRTMLNWGETQQNKGTKPVDDPATKTALMDRMFSPDKPTTTIDLMKARAQHLISDQTFKDYNELATALQETPLKGPIWHSVTDAVKSQLIRTDLRTGDKVGVDQYAGFMQSFLPQYLAKSRDGTLPSNALDINDPKSMISQSLQPYKPSMQGRLSATAAAPAAAPARNDAMPAIPAPDQRNAGSIYETPKGKLKWTGTGWVQP
jgi:hypothetical protein